MVLRLARSVDLKLEDHLKSRTVLSPEEFEYVQPQEEKQQPDQ